MPPQPVRPDRSSRRTLSVGLEPADVMAAWVGCLTCAPLGAFFVIGVVLLAWDNRDAGVVVVAMALALICAGGTAFFGHLLSRDSAWLVGCRLTCRGPFASRHCDLSTATAWIAGSRARMGWRVPVLVARDPASGELLTMPLRSHRTKGALLPPEQLRALADAVEARDQRAADEEQPPTATRLRELAGDTIVTRF